MKTKKWLKIISGEKTGSTSIEIQGEIDSLKKELEIDSNTLDDLNKSLVEIKKQALGGNGTRKDIKPLEEKITAILDKTESMKLVIVDLEELLKTAITQERADHLNRIQKEMDNLAKEEDILWDEFSKHYAVAAGIWHIIKGMPHDTLVGAFAYPFQFGTDQYNALKDGIEKHINGNKSIADIRRELRSEAEKIKA